MPTYDYRCERCHERFEVWQSFSEDSLTTCPVEGGPSACEAPGEGPVKKVFSQVGIAFKGDGFYKNDHGANAAGRASETADTSASKSDKSDSSKDSKSNGSDSKAKESSSASAGSGSKPISTSSTNV